MKRLALMLLLLTALVAPTVLFIRPSTRATAGTTFTVNSTADPGDGTCDATECTLREAIAAANANAGTDTIVFTIPGTGRHTIKPASALPTIADPLTIDGYTQPGASPNTNPPGQGTNAVLMIELDGSSAIAGVIGLTIVASDSIVRGLVINRFGGYGISIGTNGRNVVEGNFIGTDATGTADLGNTWSGVAISATSNNVIGGTTAAARNVISGNNSSGVFVSGSGATGNRVEGNLIGTDATGTSVLGNSQDGVLVVGLGVSSNVIGGTAPAARNVISGNGTGVQVFSGATGTTIQGNFIGTDVTGTADVGNTTNGVIINGTSDNLIGASSPGAGNVISGNNQNGVHFEGSSATGNHVEGNYIGTDATGAVALGNSGSGVYINGAPSNTIGGTMSASRNVISGNAQKGVTIVGGNATGNLIQGNFIGTDVTGTAALGNCSDGVTLNAAPSNRIGGETAEARNVISGNRLAGVEIVGPSAAGNLVQGNFIGTDATGSSDLGNRLFGVNINQASGNTIGGTAVGAGNVISGNDQEGVLITNAASGNFVQGNSIGTDANHAAILGNSSSGVLINASASNTVGGTASGAANTIAHNGGDGVRVEGATANTIRTDSIYSNGRKGIENINGGNAELAPPLIDTVGGSVSGHTNPKCYPCTVDVFSDSDGQGRVFHGSTSTNNDPAATWIYLGAVSGPNITATITDASGNTSEFSPPAAYFPPVGGIAELPGLAGVSSQEAAARGGGSNWSAAAHAALAGGLAAAVAAFSAGGWYARRRWLR